MDHPTDGKVFIHSTKHCKENQIVQPETLLQIILNLACKSVIKKVF